MRKNRIAMIMKKVVISLMTVASMLVACQSGGNQQAADAQKTTVSRQLQMTELENRVRDIYADVFRVYNREDSLRNLDLLGDDPGAIAHRNEFIDKYCSKDWGKLVSKIAEIDSLSHRNEQGFWEADYWIMGQDWHNLSISDVKVQSCADNQAIVTFQLHNFDTAKPVTLKMVNEDGQWRIDNFMDKETGMDWMMAMLKYVKDYCLKSGEIR